MHFLKLQKKAITMTKPKTDEDVLVSCFSCGSPFVSIVEDAPCYRTPSYYASPDIEVHCRNCFRRFGLHSLSFPDSKQRRSMVIDAWNTVQRDPEKKCPCLQCVHWSNDSLSCEHPKIMVRSTCMFLDFRCAEIID